MGQDQPHATRSDRSSPHGPFRVGETVVRNETEYTVEGYLGYRMLLSSGGIWGKTYQIVQKKDEKTYRSIII
jgi:hypothetical protein